MDLKGQVNDLLSALDYRGVAVVCLDSEARVVSMTQAAATILEKSDGLAYCRGALEAPSARPASLVRALTAVTGLAEGRSLQAPACLRVARSRSAGDYELVLCPVPENHTELSARGARALVFIFDPSHPPSLDAALLFQSYGLSRAEARVVRLLASGESPQGIARRLRISRETVKSHLSVAYAKTGTRGQGELVAKLLTGVANLPGFSTLASHTGH